MDLQMCPATILFTRVRIADLASPNDTGLRLGLLTLIRRRECYSMDYSWETLGLYLE